MKRTKFDWLTIERLADGYDDYVQACIDAKTSVPLHSKDMRYMFLAEVFDLALYEDRIYIKYGTALYHLIVILLDDNQNLLEHSGDYDLNILLLNSLFDYTDYATDVDKSYVKEKYKKVFTWLMTFVETGLK